MKKMSKKIILLALVTCLIMALCACGKTDNAVSNTEPETTTVDPSIEMRANMKKAISDMFASAVIAEDIISINIDIWDPYDDGDVIYVEDVYVDQATWDLWMEWGLMSTNPFFAQIKENRANVVELENAHSACKTSHAKMIHWPENMSEEKAIYEDLYDAYLSLYNQASSPSGNYVGYTSDFANNVDEFMKQYEKIEPYL